MYSRKPRARRRLTPVEKVDLFVARKVAVDKRRRSGKLLARFAELGDQPPVTLLSIGLAGIGALRKDERLARTGLRMLVSHCLAIIAKQLGKGSVDRTRPAVAFEQGRYRLQEGDSENSDLRSMPSGHSAGVAAVAYAATSDYPRLAVPVAMAGGAVMLAQLPSKNHFLSDVLAGAAIGLITGLAARKLVPPFEAIKPEPGLPLPKRR